ncbi:hypothetical protein O3G_MSEX014730 [Manduca sexta]|uniref:Uncharacterized protein n=1 Tax=Manduca sexta TaxID=7130 RepID=A0A921ZUK5_MANSE|nr:hypothetical protein O3G_MSEX014730 [Manduca sexta]
MRHVDSLVLKEMSRQAINNTLYLETCGFIVKEISLNDNGIWHIVFGRRIVYIASINVTVIERDITEMGAVDIIKDVAVNRTVGPEDATYCRLEDPTGAVVFDGFGRCRLTLERVTTEHDGTWDMIIGLPGSVLVKSRNFVVNVMEADSKMVVSTTVEKQRPTVVLACSVPQSHNIRACKFRDPLGNVLIAVQGVGEDRYVTGWSSTSYQSNANSHVCTLRITSPVVSDLGLWRCSVETDVGTHYGFLPVICPWMMQDPQVQTKVVTEPVLKAQRYNIFTIEGAVTMTCIIPAPISYCYFRARNGTTFSVDPDTSSTHLEYVGSGFDAGECGVRFKKLVAGDSGQWSCHVGLANQMVEQRARFQVTIEEPIVVRHFWHGQHGLVVEARVQSQRALRYCRFVRIDGLGFSTDNIPPGFTFIGSLTDGHCLLHIEESSKLNRHPWIVAVRISGQTVELSRQTTDNLLWLEPFTDNFPLYLWFLIVFLCLIILVLGILLGTKTNRQWTYDKASGIRNSIRQSFKKPRTV